MPTKLAVLFALLLLTACIEDPEKLLTWQERSLMTSVELIVVHPSDVYVAGSADPRTPQATLQRRFELKTEVDRAMATLDFPSVVTAALQEKVTKLKRLPIRLEGHAVSSASPQAWSAALDRSSADAVLIVGIARSIDDNGLRLSAYARLYPKTDQLKRFRPNPKASNPTALGNALFQKTFGEVVPDASIDDDSAQQLAATIVDATNRLAAKIADALEAN